MVDSNREVDNKKADLIKAEAEDEIKPKNDIKSTEISYIRCRACKSEIDLGATKCPFCSSYQGKFKNLLLFLGIVSGFLTLLFTGLTYLASTLPVVLKGLLGKDEVKIVAFNNSQGLVLLNTGASDLFISHLKLKSEALGHSGTIRVNKVLKINEYLDYRLPPKKRENWETRGFTNAEWINLLSKGRKTECSEWRYFYVSDPTYLNISASIGPQFKALEAEAYLFFDSGRSEDSIQQSVDVRAIPFINPAEKCVARPES